MDETNLQAEMPAEAANSLPEGTEVADSAPAAVEPSETPEPEKKDRLQERFDKLTREKYDALRQADMERYQREALEQRFRDLEAKPQTVAPSNAPTLEQYGYDEAKYQLAVADYVRAEARREALTAIQQLEGHKAQAERAKSWQQREAEFASKQADYREVAYDPTVPISATMAECIAESDMGPQVAYYLAKNKDEAARIAGLSERAAAREIGRIEARISAKPISPPVSKAPPPPPKIEAADATVSVKPDTPDGDNLSDAEWVKKRNAQLARRNRKP